MNCKECLSIIEEYVEDSVDGQTSDLAAAHMFSCEGCRTTYGELPNENEVYSRYLLKIKEQPTSWAAVRTEIRKSSNVARAAGFRERLSAAFFQQPLVATMLAVVLLVVVSLGLWYRGNVQKAQPVPGIVSSGTPSVEERKNDPTPPGISSTDARKINGLSGDSPILEARDTSTHSVRPRHTRKRATKNAVVDNTNDNLLPFDSSEAAFNRHIEKCEMVLRSFRNTVPKTDEAGFDILYERRVAKELLNNSVKFRREAQSQGNLPVEHLLVDLESVLGDISKLDRKAKSSDANMIRERIQESGILVKLRVQSLIAAASD